MWKGIARFMSMDLGLSEERWAMRRVDVSGTEEIEFEGEGKEGLARGEGDGKTLKEMLTDTPHTSFFSCSLHIKLHAYHTAWSSMMCV